MSGKIIVIEGTDGSGKATQAGMLASRLRKEGYDVETLDFPRHDEQSFHFGDKYLMGEYGHVDSVNPYAASVFYAWDRFCNKDKIQGWLDQGKVVILDRYTTANEGHQCGKEPDREKRLFLRKWIQTVEYEMMGLPRPDLCIVLHVPPEVSQKLVMAKSQRGYTHGMKMDGHEGDLNHLKNAEQAFLEMAELYDYCHLISCAPEGQILPKDQIHEMVWGRVKQVLE